MASGGEEEEEGRGGWEMEGREGAEAVEVEEEVQEWGLKVSAAAASRVGVEGEGFGRLNRLRGIGGEGQGEVGVERRQLRVDEG